MSHNSSYDDIFEEENSRVKKTNDKNMMLEEDVSLTISDGNYASPTNLSREKSRNRFSNVTKDYRESREYNNTPLKNNQKKVLKRTDELFKLISESSEIFPDKNFFTMKSNHHIPIFQIKHTEGFQIIGTGSLHGTSSKGSNNPAINNQLAMQHQLLLQFKEKNEYLEIKNRDISQNFELMKGFLDELEKFYIDLFKICLKKKLITLVQSSDNVGNDDNNIFKPVYQNQIFDLMENYEQANVDLYREISNFSFMYMPKKNSSTNNLVKISIPKSSFNETFIEKRDDFIIQQQKSIKSTQAVEIKQASSNRKDTEKEINFARQITDYYLKKSKGDSLKTSNFSFYILQIKLESPKTTFKFIENLASFSIRATEKNLPQVIHKLESFSQTITQQDNETDLLKTKVKEQSDTIKSLELQFSNTVRTFTEQINNFTRERQDKKLKENDEEELIPEMIPPEQTYNIFIYCLKHFKFEQKMYEEYMTQSDLKCLKEFVSKMDKPSKAEEYSSTYNSFKTKGNLTSSPVFNRMKQPQANSPDMPRLGKNNKTLVDDKRYKTIDISNTSNNAINVNRTLTPSKSDFKTPATTIANHQPSTLYNKYKNIIKSVSNNHATSIKRYTPHIA